MRRISNECGNMAGKMLIGLLMFFGIMGTQEASYLFPKRYKLIIDHDGGADDAMAIFMSILYEKYFHGPQLIALTTTHGNVNETQSFKNTQRILDKAGRRDIPIYRGATRSLVKMIMPDYFFGIDGLGDNENVIYKPIPARKDHAALALIEYSKKYKDELVIMAIGAATNIALAKRLDPDFVNRLKQLYVGAGHIYSDYGLPSYPEFNALMDVEAYKITVDESSPDKVTVIPFSQVLQYLDISPQWRTDVLGAIPTEIMRAQNSYERISITMEPIWSLLDPAVAALVLDKCTVDEYKYSNNSIILCGKDRGINTNDFESEEPNVRLAYALNKDYYMQLLIDIFSAELN